MGCSVSRNLGLASRACWLNDIVTIGFGKLKILSEYDEAPSKWGFHQERINSMMCNMQETSMITGDFTEHKIKSALSENLNDKLK